MYKIGNICSIVIGVGNCAAEAIPWGNTGHPAPFNSEFPNPGLQNCFRLTFRNLLKNRGPVLINLAGRSIALGCCITAFVNCEFNEGFDRQQVNAGSFYRVSFWIESERKLAPYGVCPLPMGPIIRENMPEVSEVVRYISKRTQFRVGDELFETESIYTDRSFFKSG